GLLAATGAAGTAADAAGGDPLLKLRNSQLECLGVLPRGVLDQRLLLRGELNPNLLLRARHLASANGYCAEPVRPSAGSGTSRVGSGRDHARGDPLLQFLDI